MTAQLGETVRLSCTVKGFQQGLHTISWTKRYNQHNPIALTFNDKVFVSDSRITVYIEVDTWVLVLYNVKPEDQAKYECHFNSDPSQKLAINLNVQVPVMKVMDGFGRNLTDQYYKVGSSLEIVCELDAIPYFWNSTDTRDLLVWSRQGEMVRAMPKFGISIHTEQYGQSIYSRLGITQARGEHAGRYSCSVPGYIAVPVRIHIIQDENQAFVASGNTNISCKLELSFLRGVLKISNLIVILHSLHHLQ